MQERVCELLKVWNRSWEGKFTMGGHSKHRKHLVKRERERRIRYTHLGSEWQKRREKENLNKKCVKEAEQTGVTEGSAEGRVREKRRKTSEWRQSRDKAASVRTFSPVPRYLTWEPTLNPGLLTPSSRSFVGQLQDVVIRDSVLTG